MPNESTLAKIDAFIEELREEGIEDVVFAAGNAEGFLAVKYAGEPRAVLYLARLLDQNIMFESLEAMIMELGNNG